MANGLTQINERNFEAEVLRSELPVLIEFGAEWCGPCKTVAPELQALASELAGKAKIVAVDIDRAPMLAREFGVQSVPAFIVFNAGRPVGGRVGAMNRKQLRQLLESVLPRTAGAISPEEAQKLNAVRSIALIDTRDSVVYRRAHIEHALNIPLAELPERMVELEQLTAPPVLYCRTGDKTKELSATLAAAGTFVAFLEGGVLAWEGAGFTLHRPD